MKSTCCTHEKIINAHKNFGGKSERKRPLWTPGWGGGVEPSGSIKRETHSFSRMMV
jgi:hypothetical protein